MGHSADFGIYYALTEKRLIRNECMPQFDFYGDKLASLLLASGVGAGFGVGFDFKKFLKFIFPVLAALGGFPDSEFDEAQSKNGSFFDKAIIARNFVVWTVCLSFQCFLPSLEPPTEVTPDNNNLIFINFLTILIK